MAIYNLFGSTAMESEDPAKRDLRLCCGECGKHLCDVQDTDTPGVLASVTADHYAANHGGAGNFEI